jgi:hypothetical protein
MYVPQDSMWQGILKTFCFLGWTKQGPSTSSTHMLPEPWINKWSELFLRRFTNGQWVSIVTCKLQGISTCTRLFWKLWLLTCHRRVPRVVVAIASVYYRRHGEMEESKYPLLCETPSRVQPMQLTRNSEISEVCDGSEKPLAQLRKRERDDMGWRAAGLEIQEQNLRPWIAVCSLGFTFAWHRRTSTPGPDQYGLGRVNQHPCR